MEALSWLEAMKQCIASKGYTVSLSITGKFPDYGFRARMRDKEGKVYIAKADTEIKIIEKLFQIIQDTFRVTPTPVVMHPKVIWT